MQLSRAQSRWLAFSVLGIFFLVVILLSQRQDFQTAKMDAIDTPSPDQTPSQGGGSAFIMNRFQRSETKNGRTLWEVTAEHGQYYPETSSASLNLADLVVYQKDGKKVRLKAKAANLKIEAGTLAEAKGDGGVEVDFNGEALLKTASATFNRSENTIVAPTRVNITGERLDVSGDMLNAEIESQTVVIKGHVKTIIKAKK